MKVAIIGYGVMGREIEKILQERGHETVLVIDADNRDMLTADNLRKADAAIEFTTPSTARANVSACLQAGIPVVCGTTGWNDDLQSACEECDRLGGTFFWSSNFSIGVNIMFMVNRYLAHIMDRFPEYEVSMTEVHHTRKKDSPSGTAVTIAEGIIDNMERKSSWVNHAASSASEVAIESVREGDVPGIHEVRYESEADTLTIRHSAKGRRGFALGAVMAAEFAVTHKGVLCMDDMLDFKLK